MDTFYTISERVSIVNMINTGRLLTNIGCINKTILSHLHAVYDCYS